MISSILKIVPKLDNAALRRMEKTLQTRFARVAKRFGKGLAGAFKGGALLGAATMLIGKILNPLKEVNDAIERTLQTSDQISNAAKQFTTTTGNLYKLMQIAKASGMDSNTLMDMMVKFQGRLGEARAKPNEPHLLQQFKDESDTAEAFFKFIQSMKGLSVDDQQRAQRQIFDEGQIIKIRGLLNQDLAKLMDTSGLNRVSSKELTRAVEKLGGLNDLSRALEVRRETGDIINKSGVINSSMIRARDKSERLLLERENQRIKSYENLQNLNDIGTKMLNFMEKEISLWGSFIPTISKKFDSLLDTIEKIKKAPILRGIFKRGRGD